MASAGDLLGCWPELLGRASPFRISAASACLVAKVPRELLQVCRASSKFTVCRTVSPCCRMECLHLCTSQLVNLVLVTSLQKERNVWGLNAPKATTCEPVGHSVFSSSVFRCLCEAHELHSKLHNLCIAFPLSLLTTWVLRRLEMASCVAVQRLMGECPRTASVVWQSAGATLALRIPNGPLVGHDYKALVKIFRCHLH